MSAADENERERNEPPVPSEAELGPESKAVLVGTCAGFRVVMAVEIRNKRQPRIQVSFQGNVPPVETTFSLMEIGIASENLNLG
jgi:hypothetical protein